MGKHKKKNRYKSDKNDRRNMASKLHYSKTYKQLLFINCLVVVCRSRPRTQIKINNRQINKIKRLTGDKIYLYIYYTNNDRLQFLDKSSLLYKLNKML